MSETTQTHEAGIQHWTWLETDSGAVIIGTVQPFDGAVAQDIADELARRSD